LLQDLMPYVEATVMATDTVGLQVLQKAKCFDCYATWHEAKMNGEVLFLTCCLLLRLCNMWLTVCVAYKLTVHSILHFMLTKAGPESKHVMLPACVCCCDVCMQGTVSSNNVKST